MSTRFLPRRDFCAERRALIACDHGGALFAAPSPSPLLRQRSAATWPHATSRHQPSARPIVPQRLIGARALESFAAISRKRGDTMTLLIVFLITLVIGQSISIGIGLAVERYGSPYTGLMAFIGCYFAMFWLAWRFAVRVTEPRLAAKQPAE
jgi:hypothetical protein